MVGKPFDRIQLEIPQILEPAFFIMLDQPSVLTDGIHPNVAFVILSRIQLRPFYDLSDEIIPSKIGVGCYAVDIDSRITVTFSPYLRIAKGCRPDTRYASVDYHLPLSILAYLCLYQFPFKFWPMDAEFGLLKISGDSIESENFIDVIDGAVFNIYTVLH